MNITYSRVSPGATVGLYEKKAVVDFLYEQLESYRDKKEDIAKAVDFAVSAGLHPGGFVLIAKENDEIVGVVVINKTGMEGYIPENILIYLAVHKRLRGKGLGKTLLNKVIGHTDGNIALHVEKNNPAKFLYEKLGFTNPYLEMRLIKK